MKRTLKEIRKYSHTLVARLGVATNWQRIFMIQSKAIGYLNQVPIVLFGRSGRTWILYIVDFARFARKVKRHQGYKGLAIVLKVANVALMRFGGGQPLPNSFALGPVRVSFSGRGLPTFLPRQARKELRRGNARVLRFYLTLTSLYRVLDYKGRLKLSTITNPGKEFDVISYISFLPIFFGYLKKSMEGLEKGKVKPFFISKSGPGTEYRPVVNKSGTVKLLLYNSTAVLTMQAMAFRQSKFKDLYDVMSKFATFWEGGDALMRSLASIGDEGLKIPFLHRLIPAYLGKLGLKDEPGKVRVFAMVDWWTQVLLKPLHLMIFSLLRKIRQDATFDQGRGVRYANRLSQLGLKAYCYDLSAATDRLPVLLQAMLVNNIVPGLGQLWAELLVERAYAVPVAARRRGFHVAEAVKYSVGQPMGALSSWAMLALTHHFIVQLAAFRAGHRAWFRLYVVLGDDVVIFDHDVALRYCAIMADLGVDIGFAKSLVSKDSFEFAKRYYRRGEDLSPLSFREIDVASVSLYGLLALLDRFGGSEVGIARVYRLRGFGYKSLSRIKSRLESMSERMRTLTVFLSYPGVSCISFDKFSSWVQMTSQGHSAAKISLQSLRDLVLEVVKVLDPTKDRDWQTFRPKHGPFGHDTTGLYEIKHWRIDTVQADIQSLLWPSQREINETLHESDLSWDKLPWDSVSGDPSVESLDVFIEQVFRYEQEASMIQADYPMAIRREDSPPLKLPTKILRYWLKFSKARK